MTKEEYLSYFSGKIIGAKQEVIAPSVADALSKFCFQEPEFKQAVLQSGKTFQECLDSVVKGIGRSISDLDVYRRAVKFYFSTATVHFHMTIDLSGDNGAPPIIMAQNDNKTLNVSLDDLLDF